ncbi:uncharacterized protein [Henckelia pumila]|uniref:uncharacterized protein n=1 Tax=Henckelia pumila TaxID=405737 RepID=UPI003C6E78F6
MKGYEETEVLTISSDDPTDEWILESGCTYHMSPRKDWFSDFKEAETGYVLLGNNESCKILGVGSIKLKMWDGSVKILSDVRYIPDLKRNLISLGTLDQKGLTYKAQGDILKVVKGSLAIMKSILKQGLYVLQGNTLSSKTHMATSNKNQTIFWHQRLGHMKLASSKQAEQSFHEKEQLPTKNNTSKNDEGGADHKLTEEFFDMSHTNNERSHHATDIMDENKDYLSDDTFSDKHQEDYLLARDRVRRKIRLPSRFASSEFTAFALNVVDLMDLKEPTTYKKTVKSKDKAKWLKAVKEEFSSLIKNNTWILIDKPKDKKVIGCKWVFKKNPQVPEVEGPRFKARLVAKGFSQIEGIDYHEVSSSVVKHSFIRILLAITAMQDLEFEQLDVKTDFLHGNLEEKILMAQPKGFEIDPQAGKFCLLQKSIYCLKQSPRQWYKRFDVFMLQHGYMRSKFDSCVYFRKLQNQYFIYLLIYVDYMIIACKDLSEIQKLKYQLNSEFEMKNLGATKQILGIEIRRDRKLRTLTLSQGRYIDKVLNLFKMAESKAVSKFYWCSFQANVSTAGSRGIRGHSYEEYTLF